jgi:hypothetical protein
MVDYEIDDLKKAINELRQTIETFPKKHPLLFNPFFRLIFAFFRGLTYSFGIIVAFAIVAPFFVVMLKQIDWVPLIGGFLTDIASRIEVSKIFGIP